ncbi:MAG: sugar ABC transporter permease [Clostridia bacterium]|nr:sugar ABC transporter permease [Clostridia bacterium]
MKSQTLAAEGRGLLRSRRNTVAGAQVVKKSKWRAILRNYELYIFLLPALAYIAVFMYAPMYGVLMAFKDYNMAKGVMASPWVGLENFRRFFAGYNFWTTLWNTLALSLYYLAATLPLPIVLALIFNNIRTGMFKKSVQMITYAPNFISVVVLVGIMKILMTPETGVFNVLLTKFCGAGVIDVFGKPEYFRHLYVWSGVWQTLGWNSIIYVAALAGISPDLYEAATIDGASRLQKIWYLEIPSILPTAVIILILNTGSVMNLGFEKVYLMQTPLNLAVSETIPTYVYKMGVIAGDYSLATAIGLFNSVVSGVLLVIVNFISKKFSETSLY